MGPLAEAVRSCGNPGEVVDGGPGFPTGVGRSGRWRGGGPELSIPGQLPQPGWGKVADPTMNGPREGGRMAAVPTEGGRGELAVLWNLSILYDTNIIFRACAPQGRPGYVQACVVACGLACRPARAACRPACGLRGPDSAAPTPLLPFGYTLSRMWERGERNETPKEDVFYLAAAPAACPHVWTSRNHERMGFQLLRSWFQGFHCCIRAGEATCCPDHP